MKTQIIIHDLIEEMFNSSIFDKNQLWNNFLSYDFSIFDLKQIEEIRNKNEIKFSSLSEQTLLDVFNCFFHRHGFFDLQFDNFQEGWRYATIEMFFNDELDLGYIYANDSREIYPFKGFSNGEKIFESLNNY